MHDAAAVFAAYAVLFAAAAAGKVDAWHGWSVLADCVAPRRLRRVVRLALPAVEGAIAVAIVAAPKVGLAAAGGVLATFAVVVAVLAPRLGGEKCNCFGAIFAAEIGPRLALRNAALAAMATTLLVASWPRALP